MSAYRERAPVVAGHRVALDAEEWAVVEDAIGRGDDWYVAAVVRDGDRVAFVRNRWSDGWVLPGGKVDAGEPFPAAVEREVAEETGLDASVTEPVACIEQTFTPGTAVDSDDAGRLERAVTGHLVVFAARAESTRLASSPGVTADEIEEARWFDSLPDRVDGVPRDLLGRIMEAAR